jgi:hypothetical protein
MKTFIGLLFFIAGTLPLKGNTVATDDFNRADETPLLVGGNWQQSLGGGSVNLVNNQVDGTSAGEAVYYWQGAGTLTTPGSLSAPKWYKRVDRWAWCCSVQTTRRSLSPGAVVSIRNNSTFTGT